MGNEQPAAYYDSHLTGVSKPLEQSPWLAVYAVTANLLPPAEQDPLIADLGCGTGRLAKLLWSRGYRHYWGVDFSPARIAEATRYVPGANFEVGDLFDGAMRERFAELDAFVALEILEHVEGDIELVQAIPAGRTVVFSVPNYDSAGHVRTFDGVDDARARYDHLLSFCPEDYAVLPNRRPEKKIFVLRGTRR